MKPALFYDTETTGLPDWSAPSEAPHQPHVVQIGAALVNLETFEQLASIDIMIRPDGWTIPDDVAAIHGITTELAHDVGVRAPIAYEMLLDLWMRSSVRIGHNESFDARLVRIGLLRHVDKDPDAAVHTSWKTGTAMCTQTMSTPIVKLPPTDKMKKAGFTKHKSAKLSEAYEFFTGKQLEGAHRAMVDVQGCIEVFRCIQRGDSVRAAA